MCLLFFLASCPPSHTNTGLKYAILLAGTHLVNLVRPKDSALFPSDLLLLINFVTSSSSIRNGEVWTPICLPKFNDKV